MSYCQHVNKTEYRVRQRRALLIWSSIGGAALVVAVWVAIATPGANGYTLAIMLGSVGLPLGLATLNLACGRTELTDAGVMSSTLLRRRSCRWDEIERIATKTSTGKGGSDTRIVLHLASGKLIKLVAPFTSTNGNDPQFQERLDTITQLWRRQTRRAKADRAASGDGPI